MVRSETNGTGMARKPFLIIQSRVISNVLSFVGMFLILHYYGRETYGTLTFTLSLLGAFNAVSDIGFGTAHIWHLNQGQDEARCNGTFLAIKLLLTGLMVALVLLFLLVYTRVLGNTLYDTTPNLILLFIAYYVCVDMMSIATITFDARRYTAKTQLTLLIDPLVRVPLVAILAPAHVHAFVLYLSYIAGAAAALVSALLLLSRHPIGYPSRRLLRSYLAFAFPLFLVTPSNTIANNVDKLLIGFFWTSKEVGSYAAIENMIMGLAVLHIAINTVSLPLYSKLSTLNLRGEMTRIMHRAEGYLLAGLLPTVAVIFVFPHATLVSILGIYTGDAVLRVYVVAFAIYAVGVIYYPLLPATGRTDLARSISVLYVAVFFSLCLFAIPREVLGHPTLGLGPLGAAWAFLATSILNTVALRFLGWRVAGVASSPRVLLHPLAALSTGTILFVLSHLLSVTSLVPLLAVGLLALFAHATVLYLLRELTLEDFREVRDALHPGVMTRYIASELRNHR